MTSCVLLGLFLLVQEPYFLQTLKSQSEIATIEIYGLKDYEIDKNVTRITKAKKVVRFKNEDRAMEVEMLLKRDDKAYGIKADSAKYQNDKIILSKNVIFKQDDNLDFKTDEAIYDIKQKTISTNKTFNAKFNQLNVVGVSLLYHLNDNNISIEKINAKYRLEEK